jgi:hypothetical protein
MQEEKTGSDVPEADEVDDTDGGEEADYGTSDDDDDEDEDEDEDSYEDYKVRTTMSTVLIC